MWEDFYRSNRDLRQPSPFALDVRLWLDNQIKVDPKYCVVIDIGAGSGRDSCFFLREGFHVLAIDSSQLALELIKNFAETEKSINRLLTLQMRFDHKDVSLTVEKSFPSIKSKIRIFYNRFFLHAITKMEQDVFFDWIENNCCNGSLFASEYRVQSAGDEYYFFDNHYRRLLVHTELLTMLRQDSFEVLDEHVGRDLARFHDENPLIGRVFAKRTKDAD